MQRWQFWTDWRPPGDDFEALVNELEILATKLDSLSPTVVMPSSGEVTYDGGIILVDDVFTSSEGVIGSTNLTANFATETILGSSENFYSVAFDLDGNPIGAGIPVSGDLAHLGSDFTFGDVIIDTTGSVVIEGTLRSIDGEIYAVFAGPSADMIAGVGFDMPAGAIDVDAFLIVD
jgi:hypothetical protein